MVYKIPPGGEVNHIWPLAYQQQSPHGDVNWTLRQQLNYFIYL